MDRILEPSQDRPQHHFFAEPVQYRAKVQRFSQAPPEVTVQRIEFDRDIRAYRRAAELGLSTVPSGTRRARDGGSTDETRERSMRRAKTRLRLLVTELAPVALVTFTTREILELDALLWVWERFGRLVRTMGIEFEYVCVPEPHPSNPSHLHLHAAVRGEVSISTLRRLWHIALEARHGRKVSHILRGAASPGNIDVQRIKGRDRLMRMRKIARYISKYITKDLIERFNRRRYWPSRGIDLAAARVYWLSSLSQADAIRETCIMLGHWADGIAPAFKVFKPCERVAWWQAEPDPPPPF